MCGICEIIERTKRGENPHLVRELSTGYVVIGDNQRFYGYSLFLCKEHACEVFELEPEYRKQHLYEMSIVAQAVKEAFPCDKMNYECLGNGDSHVHWHLYPRRTKDLGEYGMDGKGPVWWLPPEQLWSEDTRPDSELLQKMKDTLAAALDKLI